MNLNTLLPGTEVLTYDSSRFINDVDTPYYQLLKKAIVVERYCPIWNDGYRSDLVSLRWSDGRITKGHFVEGVMPVAKS